MDIFKFNPVTDEEIAEYAVSSNVFNMSKDDIEKEKIFLKSFSDEKLGSSMERLDVAVFRDDAWKLLDIEDRIEGYNEIPLGYILKDESYDKVLIILRRMSTVVLDSIKEGISTYIYFRVSDEYSSVKQNASLFGLLARNHICLDNSEEMKEKLQKMGITNDVESMKVKE
jgi:hypothetical protein